MVESADGFRTGAVEVADGTVHYREIGEGAPVLFVHGWAVNGHLWDEVATELGGSYRCIVPDLPLGSHREALGGGADISPPGVAELIVELIGALELERPTLVGNDSGGAICQIAVTEHPGAAGGLVLTNCDAFEEFPPSFFKLFGKLVRIPGFMDLLASCLRPPAVRRSPLAYGLLSKRRLPDDLLDSWVRPMIEDRAIRRESGRFAAAIDPAQTLRAAEKLPELEIPVLLAWGEDDRFFTVELAERLERAIPDARLVRIPDAVTFVSIDQPERLASEIDRFLVGRRQPDAQI